MSPDMHYSQGSEIKVGDMQKIYPKIGKLRVKIKSGGLKKIPYS